MFFFKKTNLRRDQVRKDIAEERLAKIKKYFNPAVINSILLWIFFVICCTAVLSFEYIYQAKYYDMLATSAVVLLVAVAAGFYIHHYQGRIIKNHSRAIALVGIFIVFLAATKIGSLLSVHKSSWATGTAVAAAIIMTITYNQRFAMGMSLLYCILACFASGQNQITLNLFLTAATGSITCCFSLKDIRTRIKLLEIGAIAGILVFVTAFVLDFLTQRLSVPDSLRDAGWQGGITVLIGIMVQGLLPFIEKIFRIATSMTLLDYSDANQPLLKRLAMEAPGTFSHSLLIGSLSEAAAESIGRNGLLCRVGAYYHDIGKINKPDYFIENQGGVTSRHKELSPAMSQLVIVGHVKDGIEMAKEYRLPAVLRQFIETHHGKTLIEYFYNEAKKRLDEDQSPLSESEFRYPGPKPRTKEAAIVMLADSSEGAVRSLPEITPTKVEVVVHNMAMKRLQDGQFDECDLSLRELSLIETSIAKGLTAHYHGRIAYQTRPDVMKEYKSDFEPQ